LSVQLVHHASVDCDLATAEGRSRMLSQARPLVELLPAGVLREQVEADLAQRAGMPLESLLRHWSRGQRERAAAPAPAAAPGTPRVRAMGSGRAPPQTANLLDRAGWLLAGHGDLWHEMPQASHDLLRSQPAPYGAFFGALERVLHEHGAMSFASLLEQMTADVEAEAYLPMLARLQQFHDASDGVPADDLAAVVHQLKLRAVADELNWLLESGELSDTESARFNALIRLREQLKTQPPSPLQAG